MVQPAAQGVKYSVCDVCGGREFDPYSVGVVQCRTCQLVVAEYIPTTEQLVQLYQKDYFFGKEYFDYEADRPALEHNFKRRIVKYKEAFKPDAVVIEIGSAYGYFLNLLQGKVKQTKGFEVSEDGVEFARNEFGLDVSNEDYLAQDIAKASVDTIVLWDVVEHLTDPSAFFEKFSKELKPGGRLLLTTGDIDRPLPRWRKGQWRMIHPPTHVYYFSARNLTKLLEEKGFKVESVSYPAIYRNLGSVLNQIHSNRVALKGKSRLTGFAISAANKTGLARLNFPLNTFDIMEMSAIRL